MLVASCPVLSFVYPLHAMSTVPSEMLALQRLYHWEKTAPDRIALTQPMGGGVIRDYTWGEVADAVRRMAAHLKAQGWEPGSKVALLSKPLSLT